MRSFRLVLELVRYRPLRFAVSALLWSTIHGLPVLFGYLIGRVFDGLTGGVRIEDAPWLPVVLFAILAISRNGVLWIGEFLWIDHWLEQSIQIRRNMLRWLLEAPGSRRVPVSTGRAISTFRDDVDDLLEYMENYVDGGGLVVFTLGALGVMASIDVGLTLLLVVPLILTLVLTQILVPEIRRRRREMRSATEEVTGFIGDLFTGIGSVKLSGSAVTMLAEFRRLNETRREKALRDTFLTEALRSINTNMASVAIAVTLIAVSSRVGSADFTVGDLTVFITYLPRLTNHMAWIGDVFAQHRRADVAYERIEALTVDATMEQLLDRTPVSFSTTRPEIDGRARSEPFESLVVENLTHRHPDGRPGISGVDLEIRRGEFVVITGRIGSGKSLVLRSLLGLVPASGRIRWNGRDVDDPAAFLVPPRTAYTPQVPSLFSETMAENISFGTGLRPEEIERATRLAVLDGDVEGLEHGLDTMVGARGVKLSGGQVQRTAAARMFATGADVLVFDDLSSALDVHTEALLWQRIFSEDDALTTLVVSHRRPALRRADRIVLMDEGVVSATGTLDELLASSVLMRELWESGAGEE